MDNVILVTFDNNDDANKVYDKLHKESRDLDFNVRDLAVVERRAGIITIPAEYNSGSDSKDDATYGGILGALIGILGGPVGILTGAAVGVGAGAIADSADVDDEDAMIVRVATLLDEGQKALGAVVTETDESEFDNALGDYNVTIYRWPEGEVEAEIERAKEVQKELAKTARDKMRK